MFLHIKKFLVDVVVDLLEAGWQRFVQPVIDWIVTKLDHAITALCRAATRWIDARRATGEDEDSVSVEVVDRMRAALARVDAYLLSKREQLTPDQAVEAFAAALAPHEVLA